MTSGRWIPDLRKLHVLSEVSRRGTMAAAAAALSYSPSAVSQSLRALERELGVTLLQPEGRGVRLTPEALILTRHVESALVSLEQARSEIIRAQRALTGTVRVAAFQTVMLSVMPEALKVLSRAHPQLELEVVQAEPEIALPGLLARDVDLVVAEEYPGHPPPRVAGLESQLLFRDALRLALPPSKSPVDVKTMPWVVEEQGSPARAWMLAVCREMGFEPKIRFETSDMFAHAGLVEAGLAAAFLPDLLWFGRAPRVRLATARSRHYREVVASFRATPIQNPLISAARDAIAQSVPVVLRTVRQHVDETQPKRRPRRSR